MAIMIMGIGVIALATLFPISILRSVQATQLTNAAIHRLNAEAMIDLYPSLLGPSGARRDYIVDPMGANIPELQTIQDQNGLKRFGYDPNNPTPNPPDRRLFRFSGGFNSQAQADRVVTLPDSWIEQVEAAPVNLTATSVTLPSNADLTSTPIANGESRVVLFDAANGRSGQVRVISPPTANPPGIVGQTVNWREQLPAGFNVERVRVETKDRRYTWLLTVHKKAGGNSATVELVVFFRRSFSPQDEVIYDTLPIGGAPNGFQKDSNQVQVDWSNRPEKPLLKKGGYVLDAQNARWYRIQDVDESGSSAVLTLEQPIIENGNRGAILMPGIIEVFSIGSKPL